MPGNAWECLGMAGNAWEIVWTSSPSQRDPSCPASRASVAGRVGMLSRHGQGCSVLAQGGRLGLVSGGASQLSQLVFPALGS